MPEKTAFLLSEFLKTNQVSTDTRKIKEGSIYFALKGENFNGNLFASEALSKGASFVVVDEDINADPQKTIKVQDALMALQQLASAYRKTLKAPIIAVTGSNGKTTTKELIFKVLSSKFKTFATQGNLNNHIGVPLTLLSIPQDTEKIVLELGANHLKEIELLAKISNPDYGLITNVGMDHLEGYGSFENVAIGHNELFIHILKFGKNVFYNKNDKQVTEMASRFALPISYPPEGLKIIENKFFIKLQTSSGKIINTKLPGAYNFDNVAVALTIGLYFGVKESDAIQAIEEYQSSNNRSQILKTAKNTLLLDAYNANPSSMELAIQNLSSMDAPNKVAILGDMFELGKYSDQEHLRMLQIASKENLKFIFACGIEFCKHRATFPQIYFYDSRDQLLSWLNHNELENCTVLLKGSRGMALEKLVEVL
ncbi:MAG: UDP-N-acetylmuramoyl-tripeptide--D-alanyl-D-alanine ligase [Opitutaceae bacterium]|nr:UDP-N-acetylmuramoyl-tripeptide--D-alanyl-D-alanine ligase [Cytophagales bacterium]